MQTTSLNRTINLGSWRRIFALACGCTALARGEIAVQNFPLSTPANAGAGSVTIQQLLPGGVKGVATHRISLVGAARHTEPATSDQDTLLLFIGGKGTLQIGGQNFVVDGETIARPPLGTRWEVSTPVGSCLHFVRVKKELTAADKEDLKTFAEESRRPYVRKFAECRAYGEAIKSAKTVSRTLLPENIVPRMAVGTVETTGPDQVGAHRHPMLDQLFFGLENNDMVVHADESHAPLAAFALLHIPLGSNHWVEVAAGKKLYYVWMDFFTTKEGQEWLKMHKPVATPMKPEAGP